MGNVFQRCDFMEKIHLIFLFVSFTVCLFTVASVRALNQNEVSLSLSWSNPKSYQGDSGTLTVYFTSKCPDEIKISKIGIHFDWMAKDNYFIADLTNPVTVPRYSSYTFGPIDFNTPNDASLGAHSYYVFLSGSQHGLWWYDYSWRSLDSSIMVHDAYEKIYDETLQHASNRFSSFQNTNFESSDAQSLYLQSVNEFNLAKSLGNQGKWQEGFAHLQSALSLLDQASVKEQTLVKQIGNQQQAILIGATSVISLAAILVLHKPVRKFVATERARIAHERKVAEQERERINQERQKDQAEWRRTQEEAQKAQYEKQKAEEATRRADYERQKAQNERRKTQQESQRRHTTPNTSLDDPFEVLGIRRNASRKQVKEAFWRLSKEWHPDKFAKHGDSKVLEMANEKYVKIKNAYEEILKDKN